MRFAILLSCVLFTASVFAAAPEDEILQLDREFAKTFNAASLESRTDQWMSYFADNATIPAAKPLAGKEALTEHFKEAFADPNFKLKWEPTKGEVFAGGKMGYTVGKFTALFKDKDGKPMQQTGTYITIWKKQDNGAWKIVADTGSEDGPARSAM